jgi:hypothetical protein
MNNIRVANIVINISIFEELLKGKGEIVEVNHRIQNILNILLQTTFQIAISVCFFIAATTLVASSGRLVQIATTVKPITASLRPNHFAITTAQSTIRLPQRVKPVSQIIIKITDLSIDISEIHSSSFDLFSGVLAIPNV